MRQVLHIHAGGSRVPYNCSGHQYAALQYTKRRHTIRQAQSEVGTTQGVAAHHSTRRRQQEPYRAADAAEVLET
jgi:hypothetical protein